MPSTSFQRCAQDKLDISFRKIDMKIYNKDVTEYRTSCAKSLKNYWIYLKINDILCYSFEACAQNYNLL